jgi:hypothetical protein
VSDEDAPPEPGPSGRRILPKFKLVDEPAGDAPQGRLVPSQPAPAPEPLPPLTIPRAVEAQPAKPFVLHRAAPVRDDDDVAGAGAMGAGCMFLVGLASLGPFFALFHVGQSNKWTSDGPGMLCPMIGVLVFGLMALAAFGSAIAALLGSLLPGWMRRDL